MDFAAIITLILCVGLAIYVFYTLNKPDKPSDTKAIKPFIEQIDIALGEYATYDIVNKLREETISQLNKSYSDSPSSFKEFSNSIDHRLWAYKWLCNITLEELGTGKHHLRDILKPDGQILAQINRSCLQKAYKYNYISKDELDDALKSLDDQIREIGTWA